MPAGPAYDKCSRYASTHNDNGDDISGGSTGKGNPNLHVAQGEYRRHGYKSTETRNVEAAFDCQHSFNVLSCMTEKKAPWALAIGDDRVTQVFAYTMGAGIAVGVSLGVALAGVAAAMAAAPVIAAAAAAATGAMSSASTALTNAAIAVAVAFPSLTRVLVAGTNAIGAYAGVEPGAPAVSGATRAANSALATETSSQAFRRVRPTVTDQKLGNYVEQLYKHHLQAGVVGDGTAMDELPGEVAAGVGRHIQKSQEIVRGLDKWIARQGPRASEADLNTATSIRNELQSLLGPFGVS
ncbi:MAG: hypothetical protein U0Q15_05510 [Kineosporiaceae bacterium]